MLIQLVTTHERLTEHALRLREEDDEPLYARCLTDADEVQVRLVYGDPVRIDADPIPEWGWEYVRYIESPHHDACIVSLECLAEWVD